MALYTDDMKILVTGNAGSGKSTLSKQLGKKLDLPVFSLDKVVWKAGWQKPIQEERQTKLNKLLSKNKWIIDGVSIDVMKEADTIIFLDFPLTTCFPRVIKRNWRYLFRSRPELPENCPEILIIPKLIKIMWNFPKNIRPKILDQISQQPRTKFWHIQNNYDLIVLLSDLV